MGTEGRLSSLPPAITPETTKLEQAGQHHPLYILGLGSPDTLMQALQHSNLVKNSIRVLEIAPIEQVRAAPVSVAEAVVAEPLTRSSWLPESAGAPDDGGRPERSPL